MTKYSLRNAAAFVLAFSALSMLSITACESDTSTPDNTTDSGAPKVDSGAPGTDTGTPGDSTASDTPATANEESIDDMEGATGSIASTKGRNGAWYVYNDGTVGAVQTPGIPFNPEKLATPRGISKYAAHSTAKGFTTWGAGFGFNLNDKGDGDGGSAKASYDASAYSGISFWARVETTSSTKMRVNMPTKSTDPAGGFCAPVEKCNDDYGTDLTLTNDWVKYSINFSDLAQMGWGTAVASFEVAQLYAVHFQFAKVDFDVWIDDVSFIKK